MYGSVQCNEYVFPGEEMAFTIVTASVDEFLSMAWAKKAHGYLYDFYRVVTHGIHYSRAYKMVQKYI